MRSITSTPLWALEGVDDGLTTHSGQNKKEDRSIERSFKLILVTDCFFCIFVEEVNTIEVDCDVNHVTGTSL